MQVPYGANSVVAVAVTFPGKADAAESSAGAATLFSRAIPRLQFGAIVLTVKSSVLFLALKILSDERKWGFDIMLRKDPFKMVIFKLGSED